MFSLHARRRFAIPALVVIALAAQPLRIPAQQAPSPPSHPPQPPESVASDAALPDAPVAAPPSHAQAANLPAIVSGTVMDTNGDVIQGARVVLEDSHGPGKRVERSGSNGQFLFSGLPAGSFELTISRPGMGTFHLHNLRLDSGDVRIVPHIVLPIVGAVTAVKVTASPEELADEQVQIAVQQRILGVFPNLYTTYDWNAPPLLPKQKFELALRSITDPISLLGIGALAGLEQINNNFPGYGQGAEGYAKRFGAAYASDSVSRVLGSAVFPSIFHQDPRYFYKGSGSIRSRTFYALGSTVIARGDNGRWQPNYSRVLGYFAAGSISNLYYPPGNRGASLVLTNGLLDLAANAGTNLLREFVFRRFASRKQDSLAGNP